MEINSLFYQINVNRNSQIQTNTVVYFNSWQNIVCAVAAILTNKSLMKSIKQCKQSKTLYRP